MAKIAKRKIALLSSFPDFRKNLSDKIGIYQLDLGNFQQSKPKMRAIIQRVSHASVKVETEFSGKIGKGLLVLIGITHSDSQSDIDWLIKKIIQLRIFNDNEGKMNFSVQDIGGDILVVSQFTLFADSKKGNRPSYIRSASPEFSIPLYEKFISTLRNQFSGKVETGVFGASMQVELLNEGPVTIILDSIQQDF